MRPSGQCGTAPRKISSTAVFVALLVGALTERRADEAWWRLRIGGAIALLVAGLVHLDSYFGGYRNAGSVPNFGRSVLLNAIASGVLTVAVAARREWFVRLAGIALAVATWRRSP